jgi:predicted acylesterase/phospholipase RssA
VIRQVTRTLSLWRVPLLFIAFLAFVFSTDQAEEITNAEMMAAHPIVFSCSWLGATILAISLYLCSICLSERAGDPYQYSSSFSWGDRQAHLASQCTGMLALLLHAFWWSGGNHGALGLLMLTSSLVVSAAVFIASTNAVYKTLKQRNWLAGRIEAGLIALALIAFVIMCGTLLWIGAEIWSRSGPHIIIFLWTSIVIVLLTGMQILASRLELPIITGIVIYIAVVAYFTSHSNHQIRRLQGAEEVKRTELTAAFAKWLGCRPDLETYRQRPGGAYPVFIVGAEGGGAYAAAHSAKVLARLQDENPRFASHVFGISGVSGGSLGAASFVAALMDERPPSLGAQCGKGAVNPLGSNIEERVDRFAQVDILSPIVSGALFGNSIQSLSPVPLPSLDRAVWFEAGLEAGWKSGRERPQSDQVPSALHDNPYEREFTSLWRPEGTIPALMLGVTGAETGLPFHISPFTLRETGDSSRLLGAGQVQSAPFLRMLEYDKYQTGGRIRLSTAVGLSARFPYIFPPAAIKSKVRSEDLTFEFVDGGYYDNTGVNHAAYFRDVLLASKNRVRGHTLAAGKMPIDYRIYLLTIGEFEIRLAKGRRSIFGELLTPIGSIANTRIFRTYNTRSVVRVRKIPEVTFMLNPDHKLFPLGLRLSPATHKEISERIGASRGCEPDYGVLRERLNNFGAKSNESREEIIAHNPCSIKTITALLMP